MEIVEIPEKSLAAWLPPDRGSTARGRRAAANLVAARPARLSRPPRSKPGGAMGSSLGPIAASRQLSALPATPETVAGFVLHCKEMGKKPATVRRYLSTIARFHRAAELFNPCASEAVQMEVKGMTNEVSVAPAPGEGPWDGRNPGLSELSAATICRPSASGPCCAWRTTP